MGGAPTLGRQQLARWLRAAAASLQENRELLTRLDAETGDGDHGINMERGFHKVAAWLQTAADTGDPGAVLKGAAMALISSVGGASGPLYGTFFLRAAGGAAGKEALAGADVLAMMEAGLAGVRERGKAAPGDKTMIDALHPAVEALRRAVTAGRDLPTALAGAADAAEQGARDTLPLVARKGRASYLGERSAGHLDPGAVSCALLLRALAATMAADGPAEDGLAAAAPG